MQGLGDLLGATVTQNLPLTIPFLLKLLVVLWVELLWFQEDKAVVSMDKANVGQILKYGKEWALEKPERNRK